MTDALKTNPNDRRIHLASAALIPYRTDTDSESENFCAIVDLLTDLRHYCDKYGHSFSDAARMSSLHHKAEK